MDLGIEVILKLFSKEGLTSIFSTVNLQPTTENIKRIYSLRQDYINTIDTVIAFLQGKNQTLARQICAGNFLPEASRFQQLDDMEWAFGNMGMQEYARHLAAHGTSVISVVTNITFDKDSVVPKLYFKPVRPLDSGLGIKVSEMVVHEDTKRAITSFVPVTNEPAPFGSVDGGFDINAN